MKDKNIHASLWSNIVDGLKEKPAYLLIFGIIALFFFGGGASSISVGLAKGNNIAIIVGASVEVVGLAAACYVIKVVEEPSLKTYYKTRSVGRKWTVGAVIEPQRIEAQAEQLLKRLLVEGNLSLGLSYKDPTDKIVMTHTVVGNHNERDIMSDVMASFITATKLRTKLTFNKVVVPKSGNVLFSIKVAEKLGIEVVAFRGEGYPISEDQHLEFKRNYFDGYLEDNDKVIIVDDVTFRGNTIMKTLEYLKKANVDTKAVFVLAAHEQHIANIEAVLKTGVGASFYPIIKI